MPSKWAVLQRRNRYHIKDLGRPAVFLIPAKKLKLEVGDVSIEKDLDRFLEKRFGAHTKSSGLYFGVWINGKRVFYDVCVEYRVSFRGKRRIPILLEKLARIAELIGEECIYIEAGQYAGLVSPPKTRVSGRS